MLKSGFWLGVVVCTGADCTAGAGLAFAGATTLFCIFSADLVTFLESPFLFCANVNVLNSANTLNKNIVFFIVNVFNVISSPKIYLKV
jgi:hypothetical protein